MAFGGCKTDGLTVAECHIGLGLVKQIIDTLIVDLHIADLDFHMPWPIFGLAVREDVS